MLFNQKNKFEVKIQRSVWNKFKKTSSYIVLICTTKQSHMTSECSSLHCYVTINPANASKQRISQSQLNTAKSYKAFEALGKDSLFDVWWSFNQGFINQSPIIIPGFPLYGNADSWVGDIFGFHILKTFLYTVLYVLKTMHNISITCIIYYTKL